MQKIKGTPPRKFDSHDGTELGKVTTVAALSMIIAWAIGQWFPSVPAGVQEAIGVIVFAASQGGLRWLSDTRHRTLD